MPVITGLEQGITQDTFMVAFNRGLLTFTEAMAYAYRFSDYQAADTLIQLMVTTHGSEAVVRMVVDATYAWLEMFD